MLSGRTPYLAGSGEYTEMLFKLFTTEPEPLAQLRPDLPEGLTAAVTRALQRDPGARFASAADMAEALAPFADERSAQVLARVRGRRSHGPAHSVTPIAPEARAQKDEATARTFASAGVSSPPPSTEVGVTREARSSRVTTRKRAGVAVAVVTVLAAATGLLALRAHPTQGQKAPDPRATLAPAGPDEATPPPLVASTPAADSAPLAATLAPESEALPAPSATPSTHVVTAPPKVSRPSTTPTPSAAQTATATAAVRSPRN